jgi:hypothetical protein
MKDLFFFDSMLTPKIITFVYWLMLFTAVIASIGVMAAPFPGAFFAGLAVLIGGVVLTRIWCELLIVLFKIHESAQAVARKG